MQAGAQADPSAGSDGVDHVDASDARNKELTAAVLKGVGKAVTCEWLVPMMEGLRVIGKAIDREAGWWEGCDCHEHLKKQHKTYAARKRALEEMLGERSCIWEGARGTTFILRGLERMQHNLMRAWSKDLDKYLTAAD
jgi:hypothetical protein